MKLRILSNEPTLNLRPFKIVSVFLPLISSQVSQICTAPNGMTCPTGYAITCPDANGKQHCASVKTNVKLLLDPNKNPSPIGAYLAVNAQTPSKQPITQPQGNPNSLNNMLRYNPSNLPDPCSSFPCSSNEQCYSFYSNQSNNIEYFCHPISQARSNNLSTGRSMLRPQTQSSTTCPP